MVTIPKIKKQLNAKKGKAVKINGERYRVIDTFGFHVLTQNIQYGWKECFTYGELLVTYSNK